MIELKLTSDSSVLEISSEDFLTPQFLHEMGKAFIYHIREEAKHDLKKQGNKPTPRGKPEGIPTDPKFLDSFGYEIKPDKSIEIYSTWEWIDQIVQGRPSFPMKWITKPLKVPISKGRTSVVRSAPDFRQPWIHPGFQKHDFITRGVEKAFSRIQANLANQVKKVFEGRAR